jgi:hypothetical protein
MALDLGIARFLQGRNAGVFFYSGITMRRTVSASAPSGTGLLRMDACKRAR